VGVFEKNNFYIKLSVLIIKKIKLIYILRNKAMKNIKETLFLLLLIFTSTLFLSCSASVDLTYWKDPNYKGTKFSKIMVLAIVKNLEYKKALEYKVASSLKEAGLNAVPSMELMSPESDYSQDEMIGIMSKNSIDGILTLKYTGSKLRKQYYSGGFYDYYYGGRGYWGTPGYIEYYKEVRIECRLFPPTLDNSIWIATTKTTNYTGLNNLASSLGDAITKNLVEAKLIQ
jgi:hypothetical protein